MESKHLIELCSLSKAYGDTEALKSVDLYIRDGEFLTLLGPSGCGKTTMLRLIAGFVMPTGGKVIFDGKDITNIPPYKRHVNTVFQRYALFPHLSVFDNVAFGLKIKKRSKAETKERVDEMLRLVGLEGYGDRWIEQLSGGQQQRVAIARALANEPEVLLLDEPLGALDLKLRKTMQVELKNLQQKLGITFIYVTHDQEEALTMSDTIVVLKDGVIQQIGTPTDIYNEPKNAFVADFIGESNIIDGTMITDYKVMFGGDEYTCVDAGFGDNVPVEVVVRPEDVDILPADAVGDNLTSGVVTHVLFMGVHYEITVQSGEFSYMVHTTDLVDVNEEVKLQILPDAIHIMNKTK